MAKIKVKKITLDRAEGPTALLGPPVTRSSFEDADRILRDWAHTAPAGGGYDKVDFRIEWQDGETYEGRYDMKREDESRANLLGSHVQEFLSFQGGLWCPPHLSREDYEAYLERMEREKGAPKRMDYVRFLQKYEL